MSNYTQVSEGFRREWERPAFQDAFGIFRDWMNDVVRHWADKIVARCPGPAYANPNIMFETGTAFQRITGSKLYRLAASIPILKEEGKIPKHHMFWHIKSYQSFVVEHNWLEAFRNAENFHPPIDGDFKLPYERCVFEFNFLGKRVFYFARVHNDVLKIDDAMIEIKDSFLSLSAIRDDLPGSTIKTYINFMIAAFFFHTRAICIALEGEAAICETIKIPPKLARSRERRGKIPMNNYSVVRLTNRKHYEYDHSPDTADHEKQRKRLHWRRGHVRHYETYNVWIKWQLVGNPDLGFIHKHYRL